METKTILHMTKGDGEFSYAHNANSHETVLSHIIKPILENAIKCLLTSDAMRPNNVLKVADLGCGVGQTPIAVISTITQIVHKISKELKWENDEVQEIQMYMSDLPSNDFNLLFKDVRKLQDGQENSDDGPLCYVMGAPGSFHDRLFPRNSLHLVHSNYAIHWLSQVPPGLYDEGRPVNKGNVLASETSPPEAIKAYYSQFQRDFTSFLKCRSYEVVPDGYMVLSTTCRPSIKPWGTRLLEFLPKGLASLVSKGLIKEEKLDSFDLPMYFPCKEEIQEIVAKEGSFEIEHLDVVFDEAQNEIKDTKLTAKFVSKIIRSTTEVLVSYHFGEQVWDVLYDELHQVVLEDLESNVGPFNIFNIVIFLRRKNILF